VINSLQKDKTESTITGKSNLNYIANLLENTRTPYPVKEIVEETDIKLKSNAKFGKTFDTSQTQVIRRKSINPFNLADSDLFNSLNSDEQSKPKFDQSIETWGPNNKLLYEFIPTPRINEIFDSFKNSFEFNISKVNK
jgi:hypothetical protein